MLDMFISLRKGSISLNVVIVKYAKPWQNIIQYISKNSNIIIIINKTNFPYYLLFHYHHHHYSVINPILYHQINLFWNKISITSLLLKMLSQMLTTVIHKSPSPYQDGGWFTMQITRPCPQRFQFNQSDVINGNLNFNKSFRWSDLGGL